MGPTLYNTMNPIGQMHARQLSMAVDAMCQQACTHAAMAGALVARGMNPSEAYHAVMAMESTGMTIPQEMHLAPVGISAVPTRGAAPAVAPTGITPTMFGKGATGAPFMSGFNPWTAVGLQ